MAFRDWWPTLTPEEQQAWRDHCAATPHKSHADCAHEDTKNARRRCRRAAVREAAQK